MERYLRVNLLGPGPRLMKKRIYRAAVSQRFRTLLYSSPNALQCLHPTFQKDERSPLGHLQRCKSAVCVHIKTRILSHYSLPLLSYSLSLFRFQRVILYRPCLLLNVFFAAFGIPTKPVRLNITSIQWRTQEFCSGGGRFNKFS